MMALIISALHDVFNYARELRKCNLCFFREAVMNEVPLACADDIMRFINRARDVKLQN